MNRRTFLKIASLGSVAFAAGCTPNPDDHLYTMVHATEDMVTGVENWYASTCRECPAGCGVLAKNREGRLIKMEGNPLHPINRGKLCLRGQAALQGLYNPDRLTTPRLRDGGKWREIPFAEAEALLAGKMRRASGRMALVSETVGETQLALFREVLAHFEAPDPLIFEPLAYEALKYAHQQVFGKAMLPVLAMDRSDAVFGFGADFLETWLSPVEYARKFKAMHALRSGRKGLFLQVSPFQSLTGANADRWIACRPGSEADVIMGMVRAVLTRSPRQALPEEWNRLLQDLSRDFTREAVAQTSGVSPDDLALLERRLIAAERPLILGPGSGCDGKAAAAAEMAALFLNLAVDPELSLFDFNRRHRVEMAQRRSDIAAFMGDLDGADVNLLLLNNVNPVFALPEGGRIAESLSSGKRFVVAFTNFMDETAACADLLIPVQSPYETWDLYDGRSTVTATLQPTMGAFHAAPALGDVLLRLLPGGRRPAGTYKAMVVRDLLAATGAATEADWLKTIQQGGAFSTAPPAAAPRPAPDPAAAAVLGRHLADRPKPGQTPTLVAPPSIRFFDGRGANRPWLNEIPDTLSQVAWQTVALIHPDKMAAAGITDGERVRLTTAAQTLTLPAVAYAGLSPETVVVPMGQGHTTFGRWATDQGANPIAAMPPSCDADSGAPAFAAPLTGLEKLGAKTPLPITSGHRTTLDRKIALRVPIDAIGHKDDHAEPGLTMDSFPLTPPTPAGYDPKRDLYPPHDHTGYRWAMIVDMDRCIGCTACVAACYAENNIGIVGEEQIVKGREMAWLQIQRYQASAQAAQLTFLPMLCQHCDNAPCEAVCPVYAPHHSKEGLNNQIYNRCIGTRFCAQNCPYKVRRFNWFDWQWPDPMPMQLNPWVTVRSKGVMEKCSFCIQRIKAAHNTAKNENNRGIRDGEVVPACAQTCPTGVFTFGSLMDPDSRVSRMLADPRAYQVMGYLNTKPAVIYLKKVDQNI